MQLTTFTFCIYVPASCDQPWLGSCIGLFRSCLLFDPTLSMSVIISWRSAMQWVRLVVGGATCQPGLEQVAKRNVVPSTIHRRTRASTSRNVRTSNTRQRHQRNIACMLRAMRPLIACLLSGWQENEKGEIKHQKNYSLTPAVLIEPIHIIGGNVQPDI